MHTSLGSSSSRLDISTGTHCYPGPPGYQKSWRGQALMLGIFCLLPLVGLGLTYLTKYDGEQSYIPVLSGGPAIAQAPTGIKNLHFMIDSRDYS